MDAETSLFFSFFLFFGGLIGGLTLYLGFTFSCLRAGRAMLAWRESLVNARSYGLRRFMNKMPLPMGLRMNYI